MSVTGWSQESCSIGAGGPLSKVVKVGASKADISQSWSTEIYNVFIYCTEICSLSVNLLC